MMWVLYVPNIVEVQSWLDLVLTLVLTGSTVLLTIFTYKLVSEARKTRKIANEPYISIFLNHAETDITLTFINVMNIGGGPAYDLKFEMSESDEISKIREVGFFKNGMAFYPPNLKKRFFLMETTQKYNEKMRTSFEIKASYKNIFGEKKEEVFKINMNELEKSSSMNPPDTYIGRIYKELASINNSLKKNQIE